MSDGKPTGRKTQNKGRAALAQFFRGVRLPGRPLIFLDFDDVLCLNAPYGGNHLRLVADQQPPDLWERLWHPPSIETLLTIMEEFDPHVVITTSWLRFMERDGFISLFKRTGLSTVADALHDSWEAPQNFGETRRGAIEAWLENHYEGQGFVILDDVHSGTGLRGSKLDKLGCLILCETTRGLQGEHLPAVRKALGQPR
jgi:hypothetical protein